MGRQSAGVVHLTFRNHQTHPDNLPDTLPRNSIGKHKAEGCVKHNVTDYATVVAPGRSGAAGQAAIDDVLGSLHWVK